MRRDPAYIGSAPFAPIIRVLRAGLVGLALLGTLGFARTGDAGAPAPADPTASRLRVLSFNVRYDNPEDGIDRWPLRVSHVVGTIRLSGADVIGLQEALPHQRVELERSLPEYRSFGRGRDADGGGEACAILYRADRLELLGERTFWLSETPERYSRGWDASLPRICTYGEFLDRRTGTAFFVFNTHFDHRGAAAREQSARLLRREVAAVAGDRPAILVGDFNCRPGSAPFQVLAGDEDDGAWEDAVAVADDVASPGAAGSGDEVARAPRLRLREARRESATPPFGSTGSFTGFGPDAVRMAGHLIDHAFVANDVRVHVCGVISDARNGRVASDHRAVLLEVEVGAAPVTDQFHLVGPWRFRLWTEGESFGGEGAAAGAEPTPLELDRQVWEDYDAGEPWERQGHPGAAGVGWFWREVRVPAAWEGQAVILLVPGLRGHARFELSGAAPLELGGGDAVRAMAIRIAPEHLRAGERMRFAFRIEGEDGFSGLVRGPLTLTTREVAATHRLD